MKWTTHVWEKITQKRVAIGCLVLLGLSLLPLLILSFYSHPNADDFNYGMRASQAFSETGSLWEAGKAAFQTVADTYQNWQGTFSAVLLMAFQPGVFGESLYCLTPFLMLGSLLLGTFVFCRALFTRALSMPKWDTVMVFCVLSLLCVQFPASGFEGFFWFNGAVFYTFFHGLLLCLCGLGLCYMRTKTKRSAIGYLVALGMLSIFIGGGNYPTALLACVLLFTGLCGCFVKKLGTFRTMGMLFCFLAELGAFAISIAAPGNQVRQAYFENPSAVKAILEALKKALTYMVEWTTLPLLLALLLLVPVLCRCAYKLSFSFRFPLAVPLLSVCVMGIELTPPLYAMGLENAGAYRLTNLVYFTFCLLAVLNVFYVCGWVMKRFYKEQSLSKACSGYARTRPAFLLSVGALFCCACLCLPTVKQMTTVSAVLSLKNGEAQAYHAQMQERMALYLDSEVKNVELEPVTARPWLLYPTFVPALSDDPEATSNKRVAAYYGKTSVIERKK